VGGRPNTRIDQNSDQYNTDADIRLTWTTFKDNSCSFFCTENDSKTTQVNFEVWAF